MLQSLRHFLHRPLDFDSQIDDIIRDEKRLKDCIINQSINQSNRARFWKRCVEIRSQTNADESAYYKALRQVIGNQSTTQSTTQSTSDNTSTNQSINQSISQSNDQSTNQLSDSDLRRVYLSGHFPMIPDFGSPMIFEHEDDLYDIDSIMKEPINQSINQSINRLNPHHIKRSKQSTKHSTHSLLCLIQSINPKLIHCPLLIDLIPIMCRYFDDAMVYSLIDLMIEPINQSVNQSARQKRANSINHITRTHLTSPHMSPHASSVPNSPVNQSPNQSVNQSINQSNQSVQFDFNLSHVNDFRLNDSNNQSINILINEASISSSSRSIRSPISSPNKQSVDQSLDSPTNQLINQSVNQSNNQSINSSINQSVNPSSSSYYFPLSPMSFSIFLKKFYLHLKLDWAGVKTHLKHLGIDISTVFQMLLERFFTSFHSDLTVVRLIDGFFAFGLSWLWCWMLALLDLHSSAILKCIDRKSVRSLLYTSIARSDPQLVSKRACQLVSKVNQSNTKFTAKLVDMYTINTVYPARETSGHAPAIHQSINQSINKGLMNQSIYQLINQPVNESTELCTPVIVRSIWSWLPIIHRYSEPSLLYASGIHGYSARNLISRCTTSDPHTAHQSTVTIIKTENAIFGIYLSHSWVKDSDYGEVLTHLQSSIDMSNPGEMMFVRDRARAICAGIDGRCFLFTITPGSRCYRHLKARQHREEMNKQKTEALNERQSLIAQPDGLRHVDTSHTDAFDHVNDESISQPIKQSTSQSINPSVNQSINQSVNQSLPPPLSKQLSVRSSFAAAFHSDIDIDVDLASEVHMFCNDDGLSIGDSSGVAISLDQQLMFGVSQPCAAFGTPNLSKSEKGDGRFRVLAIEVWGFTPPHHVE